MSTENIARRWKELSGENQWKGLLDPIDIDLRNYLILYGELVQAVEDTFIHQVKSAYAGGPRFKKTEFLNHSTLSYGQTKLYEVTKYIYATSGGENLPFSFMLKSLSKESWSKESNWIGFVAVATDEGKRILGRREVLIVWRGAMRTTNAEWKKEWQNINVMLHDDASEVVGKKFPVPKVNKWFRRIYVSNDAKSSFNKCSARDQVLAELKRLLNLYKDEVVSITVTGHGLGAALATINAVDIASNGYNKSSELSTNNFPVTSIVFGSPKVGDGIYKLAFDATTNLKLLRIKNTNDDVTKVPGDLILPPTLYFEVGEELEIDTTKCTFLEKPTDIAYNLEFYLHGISGYQGRNSFKLVVNRDIALVNKDTNSLKKEYSIAGNWWVQKNKWMAPTSDGWKLVDHQEGNVEE